MNKQEKIAFISVTEKEGIVEFANELLSLGFTKILASGGTAKKLSDGGIAVIDFATKVGKPILDHRVATLSRELHAGLLAVKNDPEHLKELLAENIDVIDLVCVDFYKLEDEIAKDGATLESVIEKTDIGGPAMARSAAKGMRIIIADPSDRQPVLDWLRQNMPNEKVYLNDLGAKAEFVVTKYTLASARFRSAGKYDGLVGRQVAECRYGENGYQSPAALYSADSNDPLALDKFKLVEGATLSYNNYIDLHRLLQSVTHIAAGFKKNKLKSPLIAIGVKHGNPCGGSAGDSTEKVLMNMIEGDPLAIFGGLIMTNFPIDEKEAEILLTHKTEGRRLLDGIIAPSFSKEAIAVLKRKGDKCRFVENESLKNMGEESLDTASLYRPVRGGFLKQPNYTYVPELSTANQDLQVFGNALEKMSDLILAWAIGSTSNSNTITLVKDGKLIGNGVGQQDRVGAAKLALMRAERAGHEVKDAVAYSDSFFPFTDGPQTLIDAGVGTIFATSGSVRDPEVIKFCQDHGVSLLMVPDSKARGFFNH